MAEIWKDIKGYDGKYQVSNCGRVRRLRKTVPPRILKLQPSHNGYLQATLFRDGKPKHLLVHRLVAQAFIGNPEGKSCVNHINGIKTDNRADNLEWVTHAENTQHALTTGLMTQGEERYNAKLTNEQARYIRNNPDNLSGVELAAVLGTDKTVISAIQRGKTYKNAGGAIREVKPHISRVPDEVRDEIRRLYVRGSHEFGSYAFAKKFGVSKSTILNIVHET